jgi:uncharacterized protein
MKTNDLKSLKVKFNEIPQGGLSYHFTQKTGELSLVLEDLIGKDRDYEVELKLDLVESLAQLTGRARGQMFLTCSRCAEDFISSYDKKFSLMYYKTENAIENITGDDVSDLSSPFELEPLSGNDIDLGEAVHEQIALEVPFQPLCAEDCKGLCSQCGINLSTVTNHFHEEEILTTKPFAKLSELKQGE